MPPRSNKASKSEKGLTKSQIMSEVATKTGLTRTQVSEVFSTLAELLAKELRGGRPFTIPGLVKVTSVHKPATPARQGRSPFTGEMMTFKAKPARKVVKVRAIKALKDVVV